MEVWPTTAHNVLWSESCRQGAMSGFMREVAVVEKLAVKSSCLTLLAMLAFLYSVASGFSQEPAFDVTISSSTSAITVGSRLLVDITIVNHLDQVLLFRSSRCGPAAAGVILRDNQGSQLQPLEYWRETPDKIPCMIGGGAGPHQNVQESIDLARWFDLSKPGEYSIQITKTISIAADTREARKSNVLEIKVVERNAE